VEVGILERSIHGILPKILTCITFVNTLVISGLKVRCHPTSTILWLWSFHYILQTCHCPTFTFFLGLNSVLKGWWLVKVREVTAKATGALTERYSKMASNHIMNIAETLKSAVWRCGCVAFLILECLSIMTCLPYVLHFSGCLHIYWHVPCKDSRELVWFLSHEKAVVNMCMSCTMQRQLPVGVVHSMKESVLQSNYVFGESGVKKSKVFRHN
jgi:hypothetical protein